MSHLTLPIPTREAFVDALLAFINDELPRLHPKTRASPNARADTPLFATGLIDSMAILHLIAFVEHTIGHRIPPEMIVMKHFQTAAAIGDAFWTPAP